MSQQAQDRLRRPLSANRTWQRKAPPDLLSCKNRWVQNRYVFTQTPGLFFSWEREYFDLNRLLGILSAAMLAPKSQNGEWDVVRVSTQHFRHWHRLIWTPSRLKLCLITLLPSLKPPWIKERERMMKAKPTGKPEAVRPLTLGRQGLHDWRSLLLHQCCRFGTLCYEFQESLQVKNLGSR